MRCSAHAARAWEEGNFEPQVRALEQHPGRSAGWVTSLPSWYGWYVLQNNGRNHILPSCPGSQGFSDKHEKQRYHRPGFLPAASGGHRASPAAGDPSLPSNSYWTISPRACCSSCDTKVLQMYLLHQPLINTPHPHPPPHRLYLLISWVNGDNGCDWYFKSQILALGNNTVNSFIMQSLPDFEESLLCT